jgi:hypothetical protein
VPALSRSTSKGVRNLYTNFGQPPEAAALARLGFREGPGNRHPGQGTACRRFFFQDQYLELLWVCDPVEARNEATQPTRLWDRWSARRDGACPFGIVLRTCSDDTLTCQSPFPTWPYSPGYLPKGFSIRVAKATPMTEPELFILETPPGHAGAPKPGPHVASITYVTDVRIGTPITAAASTAVEWAASSGLLSLERSEHFVLRLTFDGASSGRETDLRPELPLALRW